MGSIRPVLVAFVLWGASAAGAGEGFPRGLAPGSVRIVLVDTGPRAAWRDEMNGRLLEHFRRATERQLGRTIDFRADAVDGRTARDRLDSGACDAVIMIGAKRPRSLMRSETPAIALTFGSERAFDSAYLVVGGVDPALAQVLAASFPVAVAADARRDRVGAR